MPVILSLQDYGTSCYVLCSRAAHCLKKPEDGDDKFLCKTDSYLPNYTASDPTRPYLSEHQELKHRNHYTVCYIMQCNCLLITGHSPYKSAWNFSLLTGGP